jgi:protein-disulfide isomerase
MASRKEQKEQARARRLAEEQARSERAQRDRRLRMIGGVIVGVVVVVVVAIAVSSGGSGGSSGLKKGKAATTTASAVQTLLAGIPQSGARLGNPKAPVTMTYYGDLECPICQEFTLTGGFSQLVSNEVRQGKVQVIYRSFETATRDPTVFKTQQVAALAAGEQDKFWNFVELFYHEQGQEDTSYVTESYLDGLAEQVSGLNLNTWQTDRSNAALANQVAADEQMGSAAGVNGTPTLIFQGPKGKATPSVSVPDYAQLQQTIKQVT